MKKTLSVVLSVILIMTFAVTSLGVASIAVKSIKLNTGYFTIRSFNFMPDPAITIG